MSSYKKVFFTKCRNLIFASILSILLWPLTGSSDNDALWVDQKYCTTIEDLNPSTGYFHKQSVDMALNTNAYPKLKQYLEISSENDLHKLEMLTNEKDSAICSLIREKLLSGIGKEYVWDLEKKRYFPSDYIIIYRASVQAYIAFTGKYNIGYNDRGERPLILGGGHFFVFDENLNPIQNIEY